MSTMNDLNLYLRLTKLTASEERDAKMAREVALEKAYVPYMEELEIIEASMKEQSEIEHKLQFRGMSFGSDFWGRPIVIDDGKSGRRKPSYKVNLEGDNSISTPTRLSRPLRDYEYGILERAVSESQAGITTGTAHDIGRCSYFDEGLMIGYVHYIDHAGLDHGMVKDGTEFYIERSEKGKAVSGAKWHKAILDKMFETRAKALVFMKERLSMEKEGLRGLTAVQARAYIFNEAISELFNALTEEFDTSYVFGTGRAGEPIRRYKKALWKAYHDVFNGGTSRAQQAFDKVSAVVKGAIGSTQNTEVGYEVLKHEAVEKLESVEIWTAFKYAKNNNKKFDYDCYKVLRSIAVKKMKMAA